SSMGWLLLAVRLPGDVEHGLDDLGVAGATAEVALEAILDFGDGRPRISLDERADGHDHPGGAIAALHGVAPRERLLDLRELAVLRLALDRRDGAAVGLRREDEAGVHRPAIEEHGAGAALSGAAAFLRAGEADVFAQ